MRRRQEKVVVTFASMVEAMALESHFRAAGLPGRLIPVPSAVSAGCGLAWLVPVTERAVVERVLDDVPLAYEGIFPVEMY